MPTYLFEQEFEHIVYDRDAANHTDFECCVFRNCDFSAAVFVGVAFIDCRFENCNFEGAQINYVAWRTADFVGCNFRGVNFAMCDKLLFGVSFNGCILDFAKFYTLKLTGTGFVSCSLIAVDFMATNLRDCAFPDCDLYRAEFDRADARGCDFSQSRHYAIDPARTQLNKAVFAKNNLQGLLKHHGIVVS